MHSSKTHDLAAWPKAICTLALVFSMGTSVAAEEPGRLTDASGAPVTSGAGGCVNATGGTTKVLEECGDAIPPSATELELVVTKTAATLTEKTMEKITIAASMLFAFDSAELSADAKAVIDERIEALGGRAKLTSIMRVVGYTDSTGPEDYNQQLSERRARAVADYIVARGYRVTSSDIEVVGMGEADPIDTNATREGRANNRRVDILAQGEMAN